MNRTPTAGAAVVTMLVVVAGAVLATPAGRAWGAPGPTVTVYAWPLGPPAPAVVRPFAGPTHRFGPGHRGVDLAGAPGAVVHAAAGAPSCSPACWPVAGWSRSSTTTGCARPTSP